MGAPVGHTCPDIDRVLSDLDTAASNLEYLLRKFEEKSLNDIKSDIEDAIWYIRKQPSALEELRSDNDSLRTWGYE